jgi:hypothetical protein
MSPRRSARSTSKVACIALYIAFGVSELARAAAVDCAQIDAKAAATVLGVPTARPNATNPAHSKLPPDNMDLLSCGYVEATVDPIARTLSYFIYTPIPKDLASVYDSLASGNFPRKQIFSPNVGTQSSGWFRPSVRDDTFEGYIAMQTGTIIVVIKIGGMPSGDAVKNALISVGKILAKPR